MVYNYNNWRMKKNENKYINKRLENLKLESLCLADFTGRLLKDTWGNSLWWQRLSDENYHSNEISTCLPPKLKSDDNVYDREERLNTLHVKTLYTCIYGAICVFSYYAKYICFTFSLHYSSVRDNFVALNVCR